MTMRPEVAAALAALSPEQRALISKMNAALVVACLDDLEYGRWVAAPVESEAGSESEGPGPRDPLALPSEDADDADHEPHL